MNISQVLNEMKDERYKQAEKFIELFPDMNYKHYVKWASKKNYDKLSLKDFKKQKEKME